MGERSIKDDIYLEVISETETEKVYGVYYSMNDYNHRPYKQVMEAINDRCYNELQKKQQGNWFNRFKLWDTFRKTAEELGYIPITFVLEK